MASAYWQLLLFPIIWLLLPPLKSGASSLGLMAPHSIHSITRAAAFAETAAPPAAMLQVDGARSNRKADPKLLASCPQPALTRLKRHRIAPGETLAGLARRYRLIPA
ncbi:MAG TPA: hypothetical protein V6D03_00095, partial [Candidatus Caenarcaniphilales bacterium]